MDIGKSGSFIAALRRDNNLTQRELAEKLLVSDKAISRWETGRGMPDLDNLEALARIFDVSMAELLRGERIDRPVSQEEADEIAHDTVELMRQLMRKRAVSNTLMGLLGGIIVVALAVIHLTSPITIPYHEGLMHLEQLADGTLLAVADEEIEGWNTSTETDGGRVFISGHTTRLDQLRDAPTEAIAVIGNAEELDAVLYYPGEQGDVVLYGELPDTGVVTLPRLVYSMWIVIGLGASAIGLAAFGIFRKRWYAGRILRAALLPVCFTAGIALSIAGSSEGIYDATFYLSGSCLMALALYALCLIALARRRR